MTPRSLRTFNWLDQADLTDLSPESVGGMRCEGLRKKIFYFLQQNINFQTNKCLVCFILSNMLVCVFKIT